MRYSTELKYRKYVNGYGFLSFARRSGNKYGKKLKKDKKSTYHQKKYRKLLMT